MGIFISPRIPLRSCRVNDILSKEFSNKLLKSIISVPSVPLKTIPTRNEQNPLDNNLNVNLSRNLYCNQVLRSQPSGSQISLEIWLVLLFFL